MTGPIQGSRFYPTTLVGAVLPGQDGDLRADALADIELVKSQQFIDNFIDIKEQGLVFGSLDKSEGSKIQGYITNMTTAKSDSAFVEGLIGIQNVLMGAADRRADKVGQPRTIRKTPEAKTDADQLDEWYKKLSNGEEIF